MTTTVLVPLDGSDRDEWALPAATALAELADGGLHLIRVLDTPIDSLPPRAVTFGAREWARDTRREMEQSVRDVADRLTTSTGRSVTAEVAESFDVAEVLVDRASHAGLVVMATRAAGPLVRALRGGSVADRVMRESPNPVLLVPPLAENRVSRHVRFGRVLVPLDGSALALAAIDHLLSLKHARDLEYVLLEVVTAGVIPEWVGDTPALQPYGGSPDFAQARVDAERRLDNVASRLRAAGVKDVRIRVTEGPDPALAITRVVQAENADLIAMSTRGADGVKRLVLGSVAEKLLQESDVPLLLVTHDGG